MKIEQKLFSKHSLFRKTQIVLYVLRSGSSWTSGSKWTSVTVTSCFLFDGCSSNSQKWGRKKRIITPALQRKDLP